MTALSEHDQHELRKLALDHALGFGRDRHIFKSEEILDVAESFYKFLTEGPK